MLSFQNRSSSNTNKSKVNKQRVIGRTRARWWQNVAAERGRITRKGHIRIYSQKRSEVPVARASAASRRRRLVNTSSPHIATARSPSGPLNRHSATETTQLFVMMTTRDESFRSSATLTCRNLRNDGADGPRRRSDRRRTCLRRRLLDERCPERVLRLSYNRDC